MPYSRRPAGRCCGAMPMPREPSVSAAAGKLSLVPSAVMAALVRARGGVVSLTAAELAAAGDGAVALRMTDDGGIICTSMIGRPRPVAAVAAAPAEVP